MCFFQEALECKGACGKVLMTSRHVVVVKARGVGVSTVVLQQEGPKIDPWD